MKLAIEEVTEVLSVPRQRTELVERKGKGHPDSLTDGLCERASVVLSQHYLKKKGFICHHNLDKGLLVGGVTKPDFGGGKILRNPKVFICGTATETGDDLNRLLINEAYDYLRETLRFAGDLEPNISTELHPGSQDLVALYERFGNGEVPLANDTSFGVGFAPLSPLESKVFNIEQFLNDPKTKKKYPFLGEDIKVMGYRENSTSYLTCAIAWVSKFVSGPKDYYEQKAKIASVLKKKYADGGVKLFVNTADKKDSVYLTLTGTSWENGDDGQVGRGNRVNGLITPCRPMSLEAAAGKNPVSHVGKLYNLKATELAETLDELYGVEQVHVKLLSQIGQPITQPFVSVRYISDDGVDETEIQQILEEQLSFEGFVKLRERLVKGDLSVF